MTETTKLSFTQELQNGIKKAIQREIEHEFEVLKKDMVEKLDRRKDEIVA